MLENFLTIINEQNGLWVSTSPDESEPENKFVRNTGFKAYIEKGNHGALVKTVLNRRSWWSIQDSHEDNYEGIDFIWTQWLKHPIIENLPKIEDSSDPSATYNKIESNNSLSNKKDLFLNLTEYYKKTGEDYSDSIPLTFLIQDGKDSKSFNEFRQYFTLLSTIPDEDNKWI